MSGSRKQLAHQLRSELSGQVLAGADVRSRYQRDYSVFRQPPAAVVVPASVPDLLATLSIAADYGEQITCRGGGSGTGGAALGRGIVLDMGRQSGFNDLELQDGLGGELTVRAEAGVIHESVQAALRPHGHFLPADPSSMRICCIGGNIATRASGPHAFRHGSIDRYVRSVRLLSPQGLIVDTAVPASIPVEWTTKLRQIRGRLSADREAVRRLSGRRSRKIASGYGLVGLIDSEDPAEWIRRLMVGSNGTLGIVLSADLGSEPSPAPRATTLLCFANLETACEAVQLVSEYSVAALEIVNRTALDIVLHERPKWTLPASVENMVWVEYAGSDWAELSSRVEASLGSSGLVLASAPVTVQEGPEQDELWKLRKALLPVLRGLDETRRPLSVVNDVGVPLQHLASFIVDTEDFFQREGMLCPIYGHAGSGNLHLRPLFDTTVPDLVTTMRRVADHVYGLVCSYDGTITAEHGMGPLRAPYLEQEWGSTLYQAMREVKDIFDPAGALASAAMFETRRLDELPQMLDL